MSRVKVSAPGKLMLLGEHAVIYDQPCLVAAVDKRMEVEVEKVDEDMIEAPEGMDLRFVKMVLKKFKRKYRKGGVKVVTKNGFSSSYGFGSSAAVTVALSRALFELFEIKISKQELFDFGFKVVREVQGLGSGFDVAAAVYGGVSYFVKGGKRIEELKVRELPIVVGYTGVKAKTAELVRQVAGLKKKQPEKVGAWLEQMGMMVEKGRELLIKKKWQELGKLMSENQEILRNLGVSSQRLERLIEVAMEAGAYGAKLSGAGKGDCMIALVEEEKRDGVEKTIEIAGGKVLRVRLGVEGARREE
jgi:mevalonate kinase